MEIAHSSNLYSIPTPCRTLCYHRELSTQSPYILGDSCLFVPSLQPQATPLGTGNRAVMLVESVLPGGVRLRSVPL